MSRLFDMTLCRFTGLYVGIFDPINTVSSIYIHTPKSAPHAMPHAFVRKTAHVSREDVGYLSRGNAIVCRHSTVKEAVGADVTVH